MIYLSSWGTAISVTREAWLETKWQRYPAAESGWMDVASFLTDEAVAEPVVAGRLSITAGKFELESGGARIEFEMSENLKWLGSNNLEIPPLMELFSTGDLIAIRLERAHATKEAVEILLLAPAFGTGDSNLSFHVGRSQAWAQLLAGIREFFEARRFINVQTPTLVPSPGTEPYLDAFSTEWSLGSKRQKMYLPTSPEFHLKQLLARGWSNIFELKNCFRNGEVGDHHQPEFLMLEWYRAYANLDSIADDVEQLLQFLGSKFGREVPRLVRTTVSDLFARHFNGFELECDTTVFDLRKLAGKSDIETTDDDSFDDLFFRLFLEKIEPTLGVNGPLLVSHYPPSQAALSRIGAHGFAERFEIYWRRIELANAFHELNDPVENENRFAEDASRKLQLGKEAVPRDENLVMALKTGMPPSGGIALGVDRLFMALFGLETIAQTRAFPVKAPR